MAEDELDDDLSAPVVPGGGRNKTRRLILIVVLPILLVLGAAAGAYFTGAADPLLAMIFGERAAEPPPEPEDTRIERASMPNPNTFVELPELLVNLDSAGARSQYLKIRVTLELQNSADQQKLNEVMPRIMDNFQVYLRELRIDDLRGSAGIYRLREELLARVNVATRPIGVEVNDVLFREMLIQ